MFLKGLAERKKKYNYKFKNKKLFSSNIKNSFALFEVVVYNENVSDIIPFNRDVCVFYELKKVLIEHDLESEKQSLIEKSKKIAYENLPVGEILNETVETCIVNDSLLAFTTIVVEGLIN